MFHLVHLPLVFLLAPQDVEVQLATNFVPPPAEHPSCLCQSAGVGHPRHQVSQRPLHVTGGFILPTAQVGFSIDKKCLAHSLILIFFRDIKIAVSEGLPWRDGCWNGTALYL